MNVAFLVVTTAWLAGADAPPPVAKPVPAPAHPAPAVSSACCDSCCDSCGHRLLDKLRGMFHRDDCCEPCGGGGHRLSGWFHRDDCGDCGGCDEGCGHRLFGKLRGLFHRHDCCETDCCASAAPGPIRAEPIPAPKGGEPPRKMPEAPKKSVQIITPAEPALAPANRLLIEQ